MYSEDDMLMLSGIQHFRFCPRQWALIHIEQQWDDNRLTIEGQILHKHVDDPFYRQKCGDQITLRAVNIASRELGLYGISDAIELLLHLWKIRSCILNIQDVGDRWLWSISMADPKRMKWMKCSWRHKRCVLKKCTQSIYPTVCSFMENFVIE